MKTRLTSTIVTGLLVCTGMAARAADHGDGTSTGIALALEPAADITDLFTWMTPDATKVNFVLNVFPGADANSKFSDAVKYVIHAASVSAYLGAAQQRDIICTFGSAVPQIASCWLVNPATHQVVDYLSGDASGAAGVASADSKLKVFAGLRADAFFFNLAGFRNATSVVAAALKEAGPTATGTYIKGLDPAAPVCPVLTAAARGVVTGYLGKDCTGAGGPLDFFKKPTATDNTTCTAKPALVSTLTNNTGTSGNVLSLVIQVDKTLLTTGGPVVSAWAATAK